MLDPGDYMYSEPIRPLELPQETDRRLRRGRTAAVAIAILLVADLAAIAWATFRWNQ